MDPKLMYKFGKKELVKAPCVGECAGCPKQFRPVPPEDGKTFCLTYLNPQAKWTAKTCPFMYVPKPEKEQKINPIKTSRRQIKQAAIPVAAATGSKESEKKNKEKMERRDSR